MANKKKIKKDKSSSKPVRLKHTVSGIPAGTIGRVTSKGVVFQHPENDRRKVVIGKNHTQKLTEK